MKLNKAKVLELIKDKGWDISKEEANGLAKLVSNIEGEVILLVLTGSRAYGTSTETSDYDFRGVFISPTEEVLGANPTTEGLAPYTPQISDETNDTTIFEVGRFIELLEKGNPNILELLNMPEDFILYKDEKFDIYFPDASKYLTKKLRHSFAGFAYSQIKKAKGMNKKIHNPQPKERKGILDFCYFVDSTIKTAKLTDYFPVSKHYFEDCGVVKLPHGKGLFGMYIDFEGKQNFRGLVKKNGGGEPNEIRLSSIPKEFEQNNKPVIFYFDQDGYSTHCKQHKEYWKWVANRNESRYNDNMKGEVGYDHKNMMHCVRLVETVEDIVNKKEVIIKRPNRDYLMSIRNGEHKYEELLKYVEDKLEKIGELFDKSDLPEKVDVQDSRDLLRAIRLHNLSEHSLFRVFKLPNGGHLSNFTKNKLLGNVNLNDILYD